MTIPSKPFRTEDQAFLDAIRASEAARFKPSDLTDLTLSSMRDLRVAEDSENTLRKTRNILIKQLKTAHIEKTPIDDLTAQKKSLEEDLLSSSEITKRLRTTFLSHLKSLGNILDPRVPIGRTESANALVTTKGPANVYGLPYEQILSQMGGLCSEEGTKIAGHRAYFLKGKAFLIAQALQQYALAFLVAKGFEPAYPPVFMREEFFRQTCQLADFEESLYQIAGKEKLWLSATSEQPLSAFFAGKTVSQTHKMAGSSTCFRKEAGSHGKDIRGIFRVHQFEKIEQFVVCSPAEGESERQLNEMLKNVEQFLESLEIPFRTVLVASGEMNDAAAIKYDVEGWFPASGKYRELASVSNCTDFQSRELGARFFCKESKREENEFAHMLNATLCAVQRTLCCAVENWQKEGKVVLPEVLTPFLVEAFDEVELDGVSK